MIVETDEIIGIVTNPDRILVVGPQGPQGPQGIQGIQGPQGIQGSAGTNGKTVLSGSVAPDSSVGVDGDFYIDIVLENIYGPKSSGAWGSPASLIGPQGPQGPQGIAGSGVPSGGLTGQVLAKLSNADDDTTWVSRLNPSNNLSDVANVDTARNNLNAINKTEAIIYSLIFG